ncbi:aldehyde dehydrogenase family protein [Mycoplasmopsis iners]|uniref:aldehyde dehydrogenase family protein n=1 Tax=Mycoplasmopsis iners TaxID=76630 RepID=UPI000495885A|nr:aldehyde dehydrogenase family protein [Mycoplasmopsis iners]
MLQKDLEIYNQQRNSLQRGQNLNYKQRITILKKLKEVILQNEIAIKKALFDDLGKSDYEAYLTEICFVIKEINLAIKKLKKWMKPKKVKRNLLTLNAKQRIINEPLGQVLIISPWNYPFYLTFKPLIGSISAGNFSIIKTSELSKNTSELIKKMINDNFDSQIIHVMNYDIESITEMLKQKFDLIFYTGGPKVGKIIAEQAAKNLTPVILELGGKCPVIIDEKVDLTEVVKKIIFAKSLNAGQTCVGPDYILIKPNMTNEFIKLAKQYIQDNYANLSQEPNIISSQHFDRLIKLAPVDLVRDSANKKIQLNVFKAERSDLIMQEEIFGPLLPVVEYQNLDEAIQIVNNKEKPLTIYLFTNDKKVIKQVAQNTSSGAFVINDCINQLANHNLPFGGVGNSGMGRYHGYQSFVTFSNQKSYFKAWLVNLTVASKPFTEDKIKLIKRLIK